MSLSLRSRLLLPMLAICLHGHAQVARTLETTSSDENSTEDRELLQKEYYRLASVPGLMERGNPTVYSGKYLEAIQFPVGGIGTGCVQYDGNAVPRYWQIFNNMTHDRIANSFFALRVKHGEDVTLRALQTKDVNGIKGMKSLEATSAFPGITYHFGDELPVDVKMEVYNPFIPMDMKNSGIPAVFYRFTLENTGDEDLEVNLLASQQNAVGFSRLPEVDGGESFAERFQKNIARELVVGDRSEYYGGNRNRVMSRDDAQVLLMEGPFGAEDEHFGQMALIALDGKGVKAAAAYEPDHEFVARFTASGTLQRSKKTKPSDQGSTWTGALNTAFRLVPGEKKELNFALAWYFPNGKNGGYLDKWDAWGKGDWEGHGNRYAVHWSDIDELSDYIIRNKQWLRETTQKFTESFYASNLPYWLMERLGNQLAILKSRTIFHDQNGFVGLWEGSGATDGSCAGNCNHVWHYAQAHARLFPEMARTIKEQTFAAIKDDGQIPYRLPAGSPAFDGQCGDIIGAYREYLMSDNTTWLQGQYPAIRKAMNYLIQNHDADKDGWLSDAPKHTTYDASMTGNPSFLSSLYLTALKAGAQMAEVCGDRGQAAEWNAIATRSAALQDARLWNGEYFVQLPGAKRATDYENGCMSDQLLGQWWADQVSLPGLYPDYKTYAATNAVFSNNFKSTLQNHVQKARRFAQPHEAGIVAATWPYDDRTPYASGYSDEVWTTFEYTIGASLIKYGEWKKALILLRSGYDRYNGELKKGYKTDNGWGNFGFSGNPFGDDECGQFYSRALSNWSVLLSAQGYAYNGAEGALRFDPKWQAEDHVSFFTTANAWGSFRQEKTGRQQSDVLELAFGELLLNRLELPLLASDNILEVRCTLAGKEIDFTYVKENDSLVLRFEGLQLKTGDTLRIIQSL